VALKACRPGLRRAVWEGMGECHSLAASNARRVAQRRPTRTTVVARARPVARRHRGRGNAPALAATGEVPPRAPPPRSRRFNAVPAAATGAARRLVERSASSRIHRPLSWRGICRKKAVRRRKGSRQAARSARRAVHAPLTARDGAGGGTRCAPASREASTPIGDKV
jgi:hypothetical protein